MPVFMIVRVGEPRDPVLRELPALVALFHVLWITNAVVYLFVTLFSFAIDPQTARRTWVQGVLFPGVISLLIIIYTCFPPLFTVYVDGRHEGARAGAGRPARAHHDPVRLRLARRQHAVRVGREARRGARPAALPEPGC